MSEQIKKIGEYTIEAELGVGGMGTVYKANAPDGSIVALKMLHKEMLENPRVIQKFFNEAIVLAKLEHKYITRLLEFFPEGDNFAIVMEYVEGTTLKDLMFEHDGLLPYDQALRLAKQILEAFQFAHAKGIIHRDIKPANVMVVKGEIIKVMDFGIAKLSTSVSQGTSKWGTLSYSSPERFKEDCVIDSRADIYSIGIMFYELFAGRKPYNSDDDARIIYCHFHEIPDPPRDSVESLPDVVNLAILKALEKEPVNRFSSCQEFLDALNQKYDITAQATEILRETKTMEATLIDPVSGIRTVPLSGVETGQSKQIETPAEIASEPGSAITPVTQRPLLLPIWGILLLLLFGGGYFVLKGNGEKTVIADVSPTEQAEPLIEVPAKKTAPVAKSKPKRVPKSVVKKPREISIVNNYIIMLNSDNPEQVRSAVRSIRRSHPRDPQLLSAAERVLLSGYKVDQLDPVHSDAMALLSRYLGESGDKKYTDTLKKVVEETTIPKVKKHASSYIEKPQVPADVSGYIEVLKSGDGAQIRVAARKIYKTHLKNPELLEVVEETLLKGTNVNQTDSSHIDAMSWLCRILGASGQKKYMGTLEYVSTTAESSKLRRYATKSMKRL